MRIHCILLSLVAFFFSAQAVALPSPQGNRPDSPHSTGEVMELEIEPIEEGEYAEDRVEESEQAGIVDLNAGQSRSRYSEVVADEDGGSPWSAWYFGLFFGPSVTNPTARYQPGFNGALDPSRPVVLKNYLNLGYALGDSIQMAVTAPWTMSLIDNETFVPRDPSFRISHASIMSSGSFNLYGDVRLFFPVSSQSRAEDLLFAMQTFVFPSVETGDWMFSVWGSARANFFGKQGFGNDLELYLGPNASLQVSPKVAVTLLYEMGASHVFGARPFDFVSDGTGLQPGVSWDINENVNVSPFLNIPITQAPSLDTTSIGASLWWRLI